MDRARRWSGLGTAAGLALLAGAAGAWGWALRSLAVDDAYITYRYAHNLASGLGFAYNPGQPVLSTTAPLFALILAGGARLGAGIPHLASALSAACLWAGAATLFLLARREGTPAAGLLAALFLVAAPLLWLSLGLETAFFLALALGAVAAYRSGRLAACALLLGLAMLTRGDGAVLAVVLAADFAGAAAWRAVRRRGAPGCGEDASQLPPGLPLSRALGAAGLGLAVMLPLVVWLTWQFGSPLPATLRAKVAQAELGVTGFYAHTTYLQGLGILLRARLDQTPLYLGFVPALAAGLVAGLRSAGWVRLLAAWGAAHLAGYTVLGVTPYYWYYAPLVPAAAGLAGLGILETAHWLERRASRAPGGRDRLGRLAARGLSVAWAAVLLAALFRSDAAMVRALSGPVPPPEDRVSKVLPEAKVGLYERVGRWLHDNTPADAVVGVTEVGVMGYYAQRPTVDFLGLLEPQVAEALARGDLYWGLVQYQPDYLALTAVSPLYAYDLRADPWFQAAYVPVQAFDDPRFWGSPLTVYRRRVARVPLGAGPAGPGALDQAGAIRLDVDLGPVRLLGAAVGAQAARPGDILPLTLYWRAGGPVPGDYTVFVHLLGGHDRVIAQRDSAPAWGSRPTSGWQPGETVVDRYLLVVPEAAYAPDQAVWEVGLYDARTGRRLAAADGRDNVRFGAVSLLPGADPLRLDFGPLALVGYDLDRLALSPGEGLGVVLRWQPAPGRAAPLRVAVRLVGEAGNLAAETWELLPASPGELRLQLAVSPDAPPGAYDLEVLLSDPGSGSGLPLLGADGQPRGDRARLTKVRLLP